MPLVDAVVDDPDLDPRTGVRQLRAGELTGADRRRVGPREDVVRRVAEHLSHARQPAESRDIRGREDDRDAVRDEPVAPVHGRARHRPAERGDEASLLGLDAPYRRRPVRPRQGRRGELHDDLRRGDGRPRTATGGHEQREARPESENGEEGERARHR
jgi:hypothetical protein